MTVAITPNPIDLVLAAICLAAVAVGLIVYLADQPGPPRSCRCIFCRQIGARR